jgi:beta-xylosidase
MISAESEMPVEMANIPLTQNNVYFRIACNFTNRIDTAAFFYSLDGRSWTSIGSRLKMAYTIPQFIGYRFGLFNYATKQAGGFVDFDYFHIEDSSPGNR